ncbi:YXWGXW repeat-containing protein [Caenimonas aquaedulcis]|uniref:YXWGXW repeat-containing protein n=1 Tax=Caenimonas aquaedulcis TaxID=2793270 RepID=A0A931MFP1_9BURK|nr:YXWGXW repeat-containing protein [Caenimonas aquaedulcis]MBG9387169.1 YXWGXW repeat-containing protein [Caenimonas aquaedulcis]
MLKKTLMSAVLAASGVAALLPMAASAQQYIVRVAPPPAIVETVPAPRPGYVWAEGHHEWRGNHYVWVQGHWLRERPGYAWNNPHWVQRGNGEWVLLGGNWDRHERQAYRDRDRDGVPNRWDHDRDGDGVPNHRDRYPGDPRRS